MYGTARVTAYGYSIYEFQVFGVAGTSAAPSITIALRPPAPTVRIRTCQITASNSPTSYNATGLPAGLSVNTGSGLISGTPTATGTTSATISAINASGTGSATLVITVLPTPPAITSALTSTGTNGSAFSYQIAGSNSPTSFNATGLPAGLNVNTASGLISGTRLPQEPPAPPSAPSMPAEPVRQPSLSPSCQRLQQSPAR